MSCVPLPAGLTAVTVVSETKLKLAAAVDPKLTPVTWVKPLPVIVTAVPPAGVPTLGLTAVTTGSERKLNWSAALTAELPAAVVTVMSCVPLPAGLTAVTVVSETKLKLAAAVDPKLTPVTWVKPLPVIVTAVPPAVSRRWD